MAPTLARDLTDIKHSRAVDDDVKSPSYDDSPLVAQRTIDNAAERLHGANIEAVAVPQIQGNPNLANSFSAPLSEPARGSVGSDQV